MRKKQMIRLRMNFTDDDVVRKPPKLTQLEKEARLYKLAKELGVKIGGKKNDR